MDPSSSSYPITAASSTPKTLRARPLAPQQQLDASTSSSSASSNQAATATPLPTSNRFAAAAKSSKSLRHTAAALRDVGKFAASELDPRLIAHWPVQFQHSVVRFAQAVASFRNIKFNDFVAAAVEICLLFTFSTTFAATIFNEAGLTQYVALGTGCTLMAVIWVQGSFALFSDNGISIGGPEITPTVMLSTMASQMRKHMVERSTFDPETMLTTLLALIIITTLCFSVVIYTLGRLKLSKLIRLIPAAVLAGYMASIGYLVGNTAIKTAVGVQLYNEGPSNPQFWAFLMPGVVVGLSMYFQRRWKVGNPAVMLPLILTVPIVLFYIAVYASGSSLEQAAKDGWLFLPFKSDVFYNQFVYSYGRAGKVDWDAIGAVGGGVVVMIIVTVIESIAKQAATRKLLNAYNMRIDHELMLVGKANFFCAFFVGMVGYPQPKLSYVNYSIVRNTTSRVAGMMVTLVALVLFFASFPLVNYLPRFWLAGVLVFAAAGFLIDNLYDGLWIYNHKDYAVMAAIVIINAFLGMAAAIFSGIGLSAVFFALSYSLQGSIKSVISGGKFRSNVLRNEWVELKLEHVGQRAVVVQLHRSVFFGNAAYLVEVILGLIKQQEEFSADQQRAKYFVLDWAHVDSVDITAASVIFELVTRITTMSGGRVVLFTGLSDKLRVKLRTSIVEIHSAAVRTVNQQVQLPVESGPEQRVFATLDEAMEFVEEELLAWSRAIRQRWFQLPALEDFHALSQHKNSLEMWQDLEFFSLVHVPRGWTLSGEGGGGGSGEDVDENLYVLKQGTLVVYNNSNSHSSRRAHVLKPGSFVNEAALCHHALPQRIVAEEDSTVLALSPEDMARLERDFPAVSLELHRKVLDHSVRTRAKIAMRLDAFKLWSRERVSKLAQANAVVPVGGGGGADSMAILPGEGTRGGGVDVDLEAGTGAAPAGPETGSSPGQSAASPAKGPLAMLAALNFDVDDRMGGDNNELKRSLLLASSDVDEESTLHTVRDGAGEEHGRDLAKQMFAQGSGADDEDEDGSEHGGGAAAAAALASRMRKRHSSAVSQFYPQDATSQQQKRNAVSNNDVASAIFQQLATLSSSGAHETATTSDAAAAVPPPSPVYQLCPIVLGNLRAAFEAHATDGQLSCALFKQVLAVVGVCYRVRQGGGDDGAAGMDFDAFVQLAVRLSTPVLAPDVERKLAAFVSSKSAATRKISEADLRRALPLTSSLAIARFVNVWDADGTRHVDYSAVCSAVAQHLNEVELRRRLEAEWSQLGYGSGGAVAKADDVARALDCTSLQAQEMVWEADYERKGGVVLRDVLETLAL